MRFKAKQPSKASLDNSFFRSGDPEDECPIHEASAKLLALEQLLIQPTPQAIREAGMLLDQAKTLISQSVGEVRDDLSEAELDLLRGKLAAFGRRCTRVSQLLEGSLRVQWIHMRSIASFTETYTAGAKTKSWKPSAQKLNIEM